MLTLGQYLQIVCPLLGVTHSADACPSVRVRVLPLAIKVRQVFGPTFVPPHKKSRECEKKLTVESPSQLVETLSFLPGQTGLYS